MIIYSLGDNALDAVDIVCNDSDSCTVNCLNFDACQNIENKISCPENATKCQITINYINSGQSDVFRTFNTETPTSIPTFYPTCDPSFNQSNNPSSEPSKNPSIIPTNNPTSVPTNHPSNNPTYPTSSPSAIPSSTTSSMPSNMPTINPSNFPTKLSGSRNLTLIKDFGDIGEYLSFGIVGLIVVASILGYVYAVYVNAGVADPPNYSAILQYLVNTGDFFTVFVYLPTKSFVCWFVVCSTLLVVCNFL